MLYISWYKQGKSYRVFFFFYHIASSDLSNEPKYLHKLIIWIIHLSLTIVQDCGWRGSGLQQLRMLEPNLNSVLFITSPTHSLSYWDSFDTHCTFWIYLWDVGGTGVERENPHREIANVQTLHRIHTFLIRFIYFFFYQLPFFCAVPHMCKAARQIFYC